MREQRHGDFETFFHFSVDLFCIAGTDGFFRRLNPAWQKTLGYTEDELLARPFIELIHPDDRSATLAEVEKLAAGASTIDFINRYQCKDGSYRWLSWTAKPTPSGLLYGIARDITEKRRAEEALKESERRYRTLAENTPDAIVVFDLGTGSFVDCNRGAEQLYGLPREALLKTNPVAMSPPFQPDGRPSGEAAFTEIARALRGEVPYFEWVHQNAQGQEIPCEIRLVELPDGDRVLVHGSITDITERKKAQEAIRKSEESFTRIFQASPIATAISRLDNGCILEVNEGFQKTFGYTREEAVGRTTTQLNLWHDAAQCDEIFTLLRQNGGSVDSIDVRFVTKNGAVRDLQGSIETFELNGQQCLLWMGIDITERKQAEEVLKQAKEAAEAAAQARSQFLAMMSHEIRTPMNGVIGMTSLLLGTELSREQREYVEVVRSSGDALLTIINDILDFSKIEAGRIELEEHPFDLRACISDAIDLLAKSADEKGLRLTCHIDPDVPTTLVTDSTRLRQIIVNLVSNAVKFTANGAVSVSVCAEEIKADAYRLHVSIRDTGIGIAPAQLDRLFYPFVQGDASTTRRYGGTGLGLSICKKLCQLLGGDIGVESEPGVGSTFHFTIKVRVEAEAVAAAPGQENADAAPPDDDASEAMLHILLAEDNVVNKKVALHMLERIGYRADVASNGREAVEALQRQHYDVVLMDMQMPEMDGLEATQRIRADIPAERRPYIIALTANAMEGDRERCLAAGMDDYLSKPVKLNALREALARCQATSGDLAPDAPPITHSRPSTAAPRRQHSAP